MSETRHLPPELSSFVGRAEELAAVAAAVRPGQVLTLAGPGGCGKTRLAVRTCQELAPDWPLTVWVGLEDLPDGDGGSIAVRVASALDVLLPVSAEPESALAHALRDRRLLLALDNCEHVVDGVARLAGALLTRCPDVAVLATSRASLGVAGERVWRVPPLDLADALELFLARAGSATDPAGARRVCDRLDRLPLALELAAGWAGTLSPAQIADSLADPFALLDGGARTAAFRQQTLEASMQWSHSLLDDGERVLFRRLAAFEPGFAADAVVTLAGEGPAVVKALRGLIDKSLVVADTTGPVARYRTLGVVRDYARARLDEAGETVAVRDRHLALYLDLVDDLARRLETDRDAWRAAVGAEYPNLRAAAEWGLGRDDPTRGRRLAAGLAWLWHLEARGSDGLRLLRLAVERGAGERTPLQARVLTALALVSDTALPDGDGYRAAREALEILAGLDPADARPDGPDRPDGLDDLAATERQARSLVAIGWIGSDLDRARADAVRARDDARAAGGGFVADASAAMIGLVHLLRDEHRAAVEHLEPAIDGLLSRGDRGTASSALCWLAVCTAQSGDLTRAADFAEQAVAVAEPLHDFHRVGIARATLADLRAQQGRTADAVAALAPIDEIAAAAEPPPFIPGWERIHAVVALHQNRPAEAVDWCRRETRWLPEPRVELLLPDTQLVLAAALRSSGDPAAAGDLLTGLAGSDAVKDRPRIRADLLEQQALLAGHTDAALTLHHEALRLRSDHDLVLGCILSLESLAELLAARGSAEAAGVLAGALARARAEAGAAARVLDLGAEPDADAVVRGKELDLPGAVAYAMRARGPRRRPDTGWASLTPTERSVVDLAVQGLSNPDIAERLFMSRGTVKTHLAHVYAKLQVANRTELAALPRD